MNNSILEEIKNFAVEKLKNNYNYCGLADGENMAMINSSDSEGNNIIIDIKIEKEEQSEFEQHNPDSYKDDDGNNLPNS